MSKDTEKIGLFRTAPRLLQILRVFARHGFLRVLLDKEHLPSYRRRELGPSAGSYFGGIGQSHQPQPQTTRRGHRFFGTRGQRHHAFVHYHGRLAPSPRCDNA